MGSKYGMPKYMNVIPYTYEWKKVSHKVHGEKLLPIIDKPCIC
jgi:hypothetical protein